MKYYQNYRDAWKYIKSDFVRYGNKYHFYNIFFQLLINKNHCFTYSFWFRLAKVKGVFYLLARYFHRRYSRKYGIQIPIVTEIGYGLYIGHGIGLIINPTAKIGNNVNLSQFTTIGAHGIAATIGNNVYIGPSVCIVNNVIIGDNASIGAGAIVTKDVPKDATVAGVPAKVMNFNNPGRYVENRYVDDSKRSVST